LDGFVLLPARATIEGNPSLLAERRLSLTGRTPMA
jgi:hypothetical protein